jgi:GcrA cell cycle regulator
MMFRKAKPLTGMLTVEQFKTDWTAGVSALELTRRCDISLPLVYRAARALALPLRGKFPEAREQLSKLVQVETTAVPAPAPARAWRAAWRGPTEWTPERNATLRNLWNEGVSSGQIAARLGMSKNAVIGRAHRMHLASRGSPIVRHMDPAVAAARAAARVAARPKPTRLTAHLISTVLTPRDPSRTPLTPPKSRPDLYPSRMGCQFPLWDDRDDPRYGTHCLGPRQHASPYCGEHHRRCYSTRVALANMPLTDAAA